MNNLSEELSVIAEDLEQLVKKADVPGVRKPLKSLEDAANDVSKAWSGSWLGYHANIYYAEFKAPPPGAHFSQEWGFVQTMASEGTTGDWREYSSDQVEKAIFVLAGSPKLGAARSLAKRSAAKFNNQKPEVLSLLTAALMEANDSFLAAIKTEVDELKIISQSEAIDGLRPRGQLITRDSLAHSQGFWTPSHVIVLSEVFSLKQPVETCKRLAHKCRKAASHLARIEERRKPQARQVGSNVFIGHGSSPAWRDLKDFVQDRLDLPFEEFNRVPIAGKTNIARLSEMLDSSAIAFLVMTGEDEHADGKLHARMNVVHEAGLFQGRLGFTKAIVVLEQGCEEFSNIQGLGQIRFPKGNVSAVFEEIRKILEREGILTSPRKSR